MKASVRHVYGPPEVLHVEEIPTPTPSDDEILVRVRAASVNLGDWEILTGKPFSYIVFTKILGPRVRYTVPAPQRGASRRGLIRPQYKILGTDIAGIVQAVGATVTQFEIGDEVFGDSSLAGFGAFAEYVCLPEKAALVPKPRGMSFEQAAAIPQASFIAMQALGDATNVQTGQRVLINGAGGGAGTFGVQIAKARGAEVTGVDRPEKLELIRSLGAEHVIDYTTEEFTRNGRRYDVILDMAATRSLLLCRRSLAPGGSYLMAGGTMSAFWQSVLLGPLISRIGDRKVGLLLAQSRREVLTQMIELFEQGAVVPVIDRSYPLEETGQAIQRLGLKQSLGKVIVTPS